MRHFLLSLVFSALFAATLSPANAQVPRMFSYQGVVINPTTGNFISDGPHNIMLNLYDALGATTPIYTENQSGVVFVKGLFNVMIGSVFAIPNTIAFDRGYFLGVIVDGGAEMNPRTPLSAAPYAVHASVADALAPGATGVVTSVNNQSGAVTLQAGTGTVITNSGSTITINSTGTGGTGIQGVQNADASVSVANPTGPIASLAVAIGGITSIKIADLAVTPTKIDGTGATSGMVLTANGLGGATWQTASGGGGLTLPFSGTVNNANPAFDIVNSGLGSSGVFTVSNAASTQTSLWGNTNGAAGSTAVFGSNTGLGNAGFFSISNAVNGAPALTVVTNGTGVGGVINLTNAADASDALQANTFGTGGAGYFSASNATSTAFALWGTSNGAANSLGVYGQNTGNGRGGFFEITNATGAGTALSGKTQGTGVATDISISNPANSSNALHSTTVGTGSAGYFEVSNTSPTVPALEVKTASTASSTIGIYSLITGSTTGASNIAAAIKGAHAGTNGIGMGVWGEHAGTGVGVFGSVNGNGGYGVNGMANGANSTALIGDYEGSSNSGTALELKNGYIKVSGGTKTAYTHTTSAANADPANANSTILSYPGMANTDIIFVTHVFSVLRLNNGYGVWLHGNNWEIFVENNPAAAMPIGEKFNVLVIKQ